MIPKIIHYCWFGRNPKSPLIEKCIKSWKEKCPDYEIKEWNEDNFNLELNDYVKEAYESKRWAFVSDYVRLWVIYNYGGIYLDTDVELINSLDSILNDECFFACEDENYIATGLGFGAVKHNVIIKKMLDDYENIHFKLADGSLDLTTCPVKNTLVLKSEFPEIEIFNNILNIEGIKIYPKEYFCPLNYETGKLNVTDNTIGIHWYNASWMTNKNKFNRKLYSILCNLIGKKNAEKIKNIKNKQPTNDVNLSKINICFHIGDISNCGGTEKVTTTLADILKKYSSKYNVIILSNQRVENRDPYFKTVNEIKYEYLYNKRIHFKISIIPMIRKIRKFIKLNNIDYLISVDSLLALTDIYACKNTNCKNITWEHFNYFENFGHKSWDVARKLAAKKSDCIVVLTDKDKKNFEDNLNIKNKIVRIYNPIDTKIVKDKKIEYCADSNIIMSCGRLTSQKGFDILIEVAKILKERKLDFVWNIIGEGQDREMLTQKIKEYSLEDYVKLVGTTKNIGEFYSKSKMFVMTSRYEGFGLVLVEAQQYLLPTISFDCNCGPSEIISDGVNGYIVKLNNIEDMAAKIEILFKNKDKCIEFSNNSKVGFPKFEEQNIYKEWDNLFSSLK